MRYIIAFITFTSLATSQSNSDSDTCNYQCRFNNFINSSNSKSIISICDSSSSNLDFIRCSYKALGFDNDSIEVITRDIIAGQKYCPGQKDLNLDLCLRKHYNLNVNDLVNISTCMNACNQNNLTALWACGFKCDQDLQIKLTRDSSLGKAILSPTTIKNTNNSSQIVTKQAKTESINSSKTATEQTSSVPTSISNVSTFQFTMRSSSSITTNSGIKNNQNNPIYSIILVPIITLCTI